MSIFLKGINKLQITYWRVMGYGLAKMHGVEIGRGCTFYGLPIISRAPGSRIVIGDRVVLCSDSRYTALGVNHPVILRTLRTGAELKIGDDSGLSGSAICAAISVSIGKSALIGANVLLFDTDFHTKNPINRRYCGDHEKIAAKPVMVDDNVFIGANSIITKGVNIGRNSIVGAGSVVVKAVAESKIVAGSPAKEIGNVG
ncbi:acyltransferase [Methylomonas sp. SURF-1]|uniref:Acyltransferase n=1 Tax=Methylomonas aurea TaxID=2952224 RepID=A0ABT1UP49_9GAMM|nr:acyltransferase [Methylomonas sp. SURF-1]MCQ8183171.1 acyltransferase [Methylomonas sp. SURF-1]